MKLAMRMPEKALHAQNDSDPRDGVSAEIIDLASRTGYPVVARRKSRTDGLGLAGGIVVVTLLGAATLWGLDASRTAAPMAVPTRTNAAPKVQAAPGPYIAQAPLAGPLPFPEGMADRAPLPASAAVFAAPPAPAPAAAANQSAYGSPTVVFDASSLPPSSMGSLATNGQPNPAIAGNDFASRIGGVGGGTATARSDVDPKTTITQGTMIPAVLETAINTDVPGFVRAVVSQDVRSFDGTRVLVPRSSRLIGQYQSGLQAGQKRAYVIWTRLIRPDGVSVAIASPASGFDGSGGLPGQVDSHFFQRFGSAMLLSVVGGLSGVASGGASLIVGGGQNAASTALQQNGQIAPTVRVRMGEPIRVFTARDLDFSQAPQL